jgi:hypothetical protein
MELKRGCRGSIWADMFVIVVAQVQYTSIFVMNYACMGGSSIYQCGSFKHRFYLLGSRFVIRNSIDGVSECLGCFAR